MTTEQLTMAANLMTVGFTAIFMWALIRPPKTK